MAKKKLTPVQKRLDTDLWIILIITLAVLSVYIYLQNQVSAFSKNSDRNILLRVLLSAACQFGVAGLGISIVAVIRKESFHSYGLRKKGAITSIALCIFCCIPYIIVTFATGQFTGYLPFKTLLTTNDVLASGFPTNVIGFLVTAVAWGFFEGFNFVVISNKINRRYPSKNKWLNWGAIACSIACILIHGAVGITAESILKMITIIISIYGMLLVNEFTGNAWGCIFVFLFLWNAF